MKLITYPLFKYIGVATLWCCILFVHVHAIAQSVTTVTGVIKESSSGYPIPGVNVLVKGTQIGTVSDADGNYALKDVPTGAILVFSFIGYENYEVTVGNESSINPLLKESVAPLSEVVVIGYGTTTKKEITGSVVSLKEKDFNTGTFNDPMGLVQGKVAGLSISKPDGADPMAGYSIILRGTNTLTSGQGPLIVIDGVVGADLKNINFKDVESFDVLKDGSAAAIYGTRGTNGVIIITTKQARSGQTKIEYSAQVSTQVNPRSVENLDADEFKSAIETYQPGKASSSLFGAKTNWFNEITRELPVSFQHNIAFSGGSDKFSHRTSFTQSSDKGLLKDNESNRYLLKTNIRQKAFNDKLELSFNLTNNTREYKPANYDLFYQAFIQNPTQPVYEEGNPSYGGYSFRQGLEYYNPVAMLNERKRDGKTTDLVLNLSAKVLLTDKLSWTNFISSQSSVFEANSYKTRYYPGSLGRDGEAEISNGGSGQKQFESTLNYETSVSNHNLHVVGGYSYQEFNSHNSYMGNSDFDTDIYQYNNIGAGNYLQEGQAYMGSYRDRSKLISLFGRVMYNYNEKYLASVSLRREGSSKFGDNHKWGWFPSVSVGWRLNEEEFVKEISWIDDLKLRVGYGVTGNQDFGNYKSLILLERAGRFFYNGDWINTYQPASNPNPDLRWEQKQELNAGIDFGIFNKRITGAIDYYYRRSTDLLYSYEVSVPPYIYNELFTNVGSISNQGIELTLSANLVQRNNFQWLSTLTASRNRNKLDKLSNSEFNNEYIQIGRTTGAINVYTQRIQEGKSLGTFYGPVWLGVDEYGNDRFKNPNPIGEVDEKNWEPIGSAFPDVMLGWSNSLTYQNWNLSFVFRSNLGGKVLNSYRLYYENWASIGLKNTVKTQTENAGFVGDPKYSSKYIEDASFLKLDNVSLGYNFKIQSNYISKLSAFCSAQNVFWITSYKGLDPEVNLGGLSPGIESLSYYPRTTSVTVGINATF